MSKWGAAKASLMVKGDGDGLEDEVEDDLPIYVIDPPPESKFRYKLMRPVQYFEGRPINFQDRDTDVSLHYLKDQHLVPGSQPPDCAGEGRDDAGRRHPEEVHRQPALPQGVRQPHTHVTQ